MSVLELFCDVDDFMLRFAPEWKPASFPQTSNESGQGDSGPVRS
jgi:hypothetical protein